MKKIISVILTLILSVTMFSFSAGAVSSKTINLDVRTPLSIKINEKLPYGYTSDDGSDIALLKRKKVSDGWEYIVTPKKEGTVSIKIGNDLKYTFNIYEPIDIEVGDTITYEMDNIANFSYKRSNKKVKVTTKKVGKKLQLTFKANKVGETKVKLYSGTQKVYTFYLNVIQDQTPTHSLKMFAGQYLDLGTSITSQIYASTPDNSPVTVTGISDENIISLYASNASTKNTIITLIDASTSKKVLKLDIEVESVSLSYLPTLSKGTGFKASIASTYSSQYPDVYYVSSNSAILSVDEQGNCIANGYGTAILYACSIYTNEILDYGTITVI